MIEHRLFSHSVKIEFINREQYYVCQCHWYMLSQYNLRLLNNGYLSLRFITCINICHDELFNDAIIYK
jgi:hypothetical protein